jgi:hypothetical protein
MAITSVIIKNLDEKVQTLTKANMPLDPNEEQELIGILTVEQIFKSEEVSRMLRDLIVSLKITRDDGTVRWADSDGFNLLQEYFGADDPATLPHDPLTLGLLHPGLTLDVNDQKLSSNLASQTVDGMMSKSDKFKLDSLGGIKSGTVSGADFSGDPKKATVIFSIPYSSGNAQYSIVFGSGAGRRFTWESKTPSGFVINANANTPFTESVDWDTLGYGEG